MPSTVRSSEEEPRTNMDIRSLSSSRRHPQNAPGVHKVGVPPKQNLFKEFTDIVKETFFADDPLRHFKDQPRSKKLLLSVQAVFPILEWGRNYSLAKFKGDLIAGLTIASLCIPQDIGYAKLAHLEPQYGLYSSFVPPLIYAFMGSSRDIAIGPVAVVSLLLGTMLQSEIDPKVPLLLQLILSNPGPVVIDKLYASNYANLIGEDKIFLTVADAVASCSPKLAEEV